MVDGDGEATGGVEATGLVVEVAVDPVELGTTSEHGSSSSADRMLRSQESGVFSVSIIVFLEADLIRTQIISAGSGHLFFFVVVVVVVMVGR